MLSLQAKIREKKEKLSALRKQGFLPAILYGEGIKNTLLSVEEKEFLKAFADAGETSLVNLLSGNKKTEVLIHQIAKDPVSSKIIHIDFFHPSSKKKIEAVIPLVFTGESEAVKSLGGILIKEIHEVPVKGLAKNLPKGIEVNVSVLNNLGDRILLKDLALAKEVEIIKHRLEEIVAHVALPKEEKIEEPAPVPAPVEGTGAEVPAPAEKKEEEK